MTPRQASVAILLQVIQHGRSLTDSLNATLPKLTQPADKALCQAMCYGCLRSYLKLDTLLGKLLKKPLRQKDQDVYCLLLLGLYQLLEMRIPDHAAVSLTVTATRSLRKPWAKELVNAVLRNFRRRQTALLESLSPATNPTAFYSHPGWLLDKFKQAWPDDWQAVVEANNRQAPMSLRVNRQQQSRADYLKTLAEKDITAFAIAHTSQGIQLGSPAGVEQLPGFDTGAVSVQDGAAQLAVELLQPQAGERLLDACAAPGGKTAHILESQPRLKELVAVDIEQARLDKITENLQRLGLQATLICGDAAEPVDWWDGQAFDRILLDAPCSATGVIRRHPDIKLLRRADDIPALRAIQYKLLQQLWPLLKQGGMLLYATCSVLPEENQQQIGRFLTEQSDARLRPIEAEWGRVTPAGQQILPGEDNMDGFFYARLYKTGKQ